LNWLQRHRFEERTAEARPDLPGQYQLAIQHHPDSFVIKLALHLTQIEILSSPQLIGG